MPVLLMTIANLFGSTFCVTNLKFFNASIISKVWLSANSIKKIHSIQTDWGGEYQSLNSFFKRIGIDHRVSCPHAHQQNGSAERKHRHIVEMGLALLAHASMPLKFWDEAFLTAVFLINRLPSRVIHNETPFERLHGQQPDYTFLRIFGCAVWPNLRPFNDRKLQFRSKRCVFLGYSNMHKGFKCLDPSAGRVYISRDVVFDESVFPFAKLHPNAGARLRSEISLLPDTLLNPTSFGNAMLRDHGASVPLPTNPLISSVSSDVVAERNPMLNGAKISSPHRHFMWAEDDSRGAPSQDDSAAPGAPADDASAPGLGPDSLALDPVGSALPVGGSSAPAPRSPPSPVTSSSPQPDPSQGEVMESAGSSTAPGSTDSPVATAASPPRQPTTRAQHGISKPKIYTDGTVRWCNQIASPTSEPSTLADALGDPKW